MNKGTVIPLQAYVFLDLKVPGANSFSEYCIVILCLLDRASS